MTVGTQCRGLRASAISADLTGSANHRGIAGHATTGSGVTRRHESTVIRTDRVIAAAAVLNGGRVRTRLTNVGIGRWRWGRVAPVSRDPRGEEGDGEKGDRCETHVDRLIYNV